MTVDAGLSSVGKNTPAVEVIRRVLAAQDGSMTVKELTERLFDSWGRDFPENPYDNYCLVYKLATGVLKCSASYENLPDGLCPVVDRIDAEPNYLNPEMRFEDLINLVDDVAAVKVSLPAKLANASSRMHW